MHHILHMALSRQQQWQLGVIVAVGLATVAFHYGFLFPHPPGHGGFLHAIHGRLCYIPIILGAIWFGVRGGLGVAAGIIVLTLPYPAYRGITDPGMRLSEYTEMVFYVAIGLTAGILIEQQWRERRRRESLQRELAHKERLSSLGQMAAGLAHEIKNPLGSIQGAAEILGDDAGADARGSDPRRADLLGVLAKESKRLGVVVDHFLSFARPRPLDLAEVDVNQVVADAAAQVGLDAERRHIDVACRCADGLPTIRADGSQLHQVLLNVLLNAVASSSNGDGVVVKTARRSGGVEIVVRDRGSGIAPEDLPRVFDPFFTTRDTGTGLGLSISHAIVTDHGGRIAIESERGAGTTVTISLPRDPHGGGLRR
jgi:signal transduction histidine kinase